MTEEPFDRTPVAGEKIELTVDIVSAYVSNNPVPVDDLPNLIASVHSSLSGLGHSPTVSEPTQEPAVNPKKSILPDYLISLEDGGRYKSLKRHLASKYGLTPDEYRAKWNLPYDYPMVAPNYTAKRSELAKQMGLGRRAAEARATSSKKSRKNQS